MRMPRQVSDHQSAQIGYVFAEGELSVDFDLVHGRVMRILAGDATCVFLELLGILGRPPIAQVALGVELASFIIEGMRQFVPNGAAGIP